MELKRRPQRRRFFVLARFAFDELRLTPMSTLAPELASPRLDCWDGEKKDEPL